MKKIKDILKCDTISEIEFYLDYYDMIEELFKHKNTIPLNFYKEKKQIEERLKELSKDYAKENNSIFNCLLSKYWLLYH